MEYPCTDLSIEGCEIKLLTFPEFQETGLRIQDCIIERVSGLTASSARPSWLVDCEIGEFDIANTNASIIQDIHLAVSHRVLLTILRKLYVQAGSGRLENALVRGLPDNCRPYVSPILEEMHSLGFASLETGRGRRLWYPDRSKAAEVHAILGDYARSKHILVERTRGISHK